jgi:nucleoid-associated protein YgaU
MGLLDFARDVGRQLFDTDAEAADNIKQHLEIKLSGIHNVAVEYDDGVATICGDCDNQQIKELAILTAGNVKGVSKVVADDLKVKAAKVTPQSRPEVQEKVEFYEIVSGDTLGGIAKKYYGKSSQYTRIFEANRGVISDPNKIYPGQKIRIPLD